MLENKAIILKNMQYEPELLKRLQSELIEILEETIRVCDILDTSYFILGGTGIGALYYQGIIPWDDDIDIGMRRADYERFIKEAPNVIDSKYEVQCFEYEKHTPCYWMKIVKRNTLFVQEEQADLPITKGIFIDVFPLDNVPKLVWKEKLQRVTTSILSTIFAIKQTKGAYLRVRFKSRKIPKSISEPIILFVLGILKLCSSNTIYYTIKRIQIKYNCIESEYVNIVQMPRDHIPTKDILNTQEVKFDRLVVKAPNNMEEYLRHHYPWLSPTPPKEKKFNHKPLIIDFGD